VKVSIAWDSSTLDMVGHVPPGSCQFSMDTPPHNSYPFCTQECRRNSTESTEKNIGNMKCSYNAKGALEVVRFHIFSSSFTMWIGHIALCLDGLDGNQSPFLSSHGHTRTCVLDLPLLLSPAIASATLRRLLQRRRPSPRPLRWLPLPSAEALEATPYAHVQDAHRGPSHNPRDQAHLGLRPHASQEVVLFLYGQEKEQVAFTSCWLDQGKRLHPRTLYIIAIMHLYGAPF
jgi:hypothetical protein